MDKFPAFATTIGHGKVPKGEREIVLMVFGPKGGTRAIERLTEKNALRLRDELNAAIGKIQIERKFKR